MDTVQNMAYAQAQAQTRTRSALLGISCGNAHATDIWNVTFRSLRLAAICVCWALSVSGLYAQQPNRTLFASPPQRLTPPLVARAPTADEDKDFERFVQTQRAAPPKIEVANKSIRELNVDIRASEGELPQQQESIEPLATELGVYPELRSTPIAVHWRAPGTYHGPIYFDDPGVERHGQSFHPVLQPGLTTVRFLGTAALMPVKVFAQPPQHLTYTLGYGRPSYGWVSRELSPIAQ